MPMRFSILRMEMYSFKEYDEEPAIDLEFKKDLMKALNKFCESNVEIPRIKVGKNKR